MAIFRLLREAGAEWSADKVSVMAAALAYYTVFSIAPLLVIVLAIAGTVFDQASAREELIQQIQGLVGQDGGEVVRIILENASDPANNGGRVASLIGLALLLFGASGVFVQLQDALNSVWNVSPKKGRGVWNFLRKRIISFLLILGVGFLLLLSLVVSAVLAGLDSYTDSLFPGFDQLLQLFNLIISFGVITLLFALIYKYVPDVKIAWKDVWVGAIITSTLFIIGRSLIGIYLGNRSFASTYGAAGSFIVLLAWIYYSVQILFFGAEITQVYARRYGSKIVPTNHYQKESVNVDEP